MFAVDFFVAVRQRACQDSCRALPRPFPDGPEADGVLPHRAGPDVPRQPGVHRQLG